MTYLTRKELAKRLNRSYGTLGNWALAGKGPKPIGLPDGTVRYALSDVEAWERAHNVSR